MLVVLSPSELRYYIWLCIIAVPIFYNLLLVVARCVFAELQTDHSFAWLVADYISDFMYLCDTLVHFRTGTCVQSLLTASSRLLYVVIMLASIFVCCLCLLLQCSVEYISDSHLDITFILKAG